MITELISNVRQWIGLKNQGVQATAKLKTQGYTSIDYQYWSQIRELPVWDFWAILQMLNDPQVRLCLAIRSAPLYGVEFGFKDNGQFMPGIKCQRPEVAVYIERQLKKIWLNHLQDILTAQVWGWSAAEVGLKIGSSGLIDIDRLEFRHAQDTRLLKLNGKPAGVQFTRIRNQNELAIGFPEAFFHSHDPEAGMDYGTSILRGAYAPWCDKWLNGGALDVRRLFMHRDAYAGGDLGYPDGITYIDGNAVPNRDIARDILDKMRSGHAIARPSERDENGNEKWPFVRAQVTANPTHILQYPKDLDDEIRRGIGIPDGVIDDAGTGAWGGKRIPMAAFHSTLDCWVVSVLIDITEQIMERLVMMNFGSAVDFEIGHKPLAEQAMEQQSNAGGGMQQGPGMGMPGQDAGGMPGMPQEAETELADESPMAMALRAAQLIDAAKIRLSVEGPQEGDTKPGTDGDLVFRDSRWHLLDKDGGETVPVRAGKQPAKKITIEEIESYPPVKISVATHGFKNQADAEDWAKKNIRRTFTNKQLGFKIPIGSRAIRKTLGPSGRKNTQPEIHFAAITALPAMLENGVLFETFEDRNRDPNIAAIHRLAAPVEVDGQRFASKITIKEIVRQENETRFYSYEVMEIEVAARNRLHAESEDSKSSPLAATEVSLRDLLSGFKFNDGTPIVPQKMGRFRLSADANDRNDADEKAVQIADILTHIYGDDAESHFEEMFGSAVKKMSLWIAIDPPRGPNGRFIAKNSPEAVSAAKDRVKQALSGKRTSESLKAVTENLSILNAKQLREVKVEYGIKAGGTAKQSLVDKIAERLHGASVESSGDDIPGTQKRDDHTPSNPVSKDVYTVPLESLKVDPKRFQYKVSGIRDDGVSDELRGTSTWNPELGGVLLVWRDPVNGEDYVINGHHRHELAQRVGADAVNVRYIETDDAIKARAAGALANIAEGRGTALDAAKYLRDSGQGIDHLKMAGISLTGKVASDAVNLRDLSDKAFNRLSQGMIEEQSAVAISKHLKDHNLQDMLFKKLEDREKEGKDWTVKETEQAAKKMANSGKVTEKQSDLFGDWDDEKSTFDQEVEIESHIARSIAQEVNDFRAVASKRRADRVSDAGNQLAIDENSKRQKSAESLADSFEREAHLKGPIADAIKKHAADLATAKTKADRSRVKQEAMESVRATIEQLNQPVPGPPEAENQTVQKGMFGEDFEPGKFSEEELADLTGNQGEGTQVPASGDRQESFFDTGKKTDLSGQELLFEDRKPLGHGKTWDVNGKGFDSYKEAVRHASENNSNVTDAKTGSQKWSPAPPVSKSRQRQYEDRKAAYEAQERLNKQNDDKRKDQGQ